MKKVIIYTTSWCGYCDQAKQYFDEHGVKYEERDIEQNPEYRKELDEKTGGAKFVPVFDIDGEILEGFNDSRDEIDKALGL